jgi:hypothetical protein
MMKSVAAFAAVPVLVLLAGCASPKDKLMSQCMKQNDNQTLCTCVVNGLTEKLTPKQLETLAAAQEKSTEPDVVQQALGMQGAMTVAEVSKTCSMGALGGAASTAPGGN